MPVWGPTFQKAPCKICSVTQDKCFQGPQGFQFPAVTVLGPRMARPLQVARHFGNTSKAVKKIHPKHLKTAGFGA